MREQTKAVIMMIAVLVFVMVLLAFVMSRISKMERECEAKGAVLVKTFNHGWQCVKRAA